MRPVHVLIVPLAAALAILPLTSSALPPPDKLDTPAAVPEGVLAFLSGLDEIEAGRYANAIEPLGKAIDSDEENPRYLTARGTAFLLAEKIPQGTKDLQRARRLNPDDTDASRMLSFGFRLGGDQLTAARTYSVGSTDAWDRFLRETGDAYGRVTIASRFAQNNPQFFAESQRDRANALRRFGQIGDHFAKMQKISVPGAQSVLYARAIQRIAEQNWAGAIPDLQAFLATSPEDRSARRYYAASLLGRGNLEAARQEFTRVLSWKTALVEGYLGRSEAAARLGDLRRARADLEVATSLDPADSAKRRARVEALVASLQEPPGEPPALLDALLQSARAAPEWENLVAAGTALIKAMNSHRQRGDERYQDRRRVLTFAVADAPSNPDRLAELGQFLLDEADVRGERVEPNGDWVSYRQWTPAQKAAELKLASDCFAKALSIDARHVKSMIGQAALRIRDMQWSDAETILRQAMQIRSDEPELLELMSRVMQEAADQKQGQAENLRQVRTWTEYGYNVTFFYTRYPSLAERDRADQYDDMAQRFVEFSKQYFDAAVKACGETAKGSYYQGAMAANNGDYQAARTYLERAVALAPQDLKIRYRLANVYAKLNMTDQALDAQTRAENLEETTAAPWLQRAWSKIVNNAWKTSRASLDQAKAWNAADPRIAAYLGVIAEANERNDEATACYQAALALEEARARLRGDTLERSGKGGMLVRDLGLTLSLRLKLAHLAEARPAEAAALYLANTASEPRISEWELGRRVSSAMLPDADADPKLVPSPPMVITVLMQSRVLAGKALVALRRPAEALQQFSAAVNLPTRMKQGAMIDLDDWIARAQLGMSESYFYLGDRNQANQWQMRVQGRDFRDPIEIERMRVKGLLGQTSRNRSGF